MNGKRKCAKVFLRNAIIIFMTFAMILTAPGLGICLSAIDISKRGNVTPVTDIAGKFEEISGIDEIDLKDAVYYSKPQNLSEVGKFKEALRNGKVTLATGKRAEEISAALSHMLPDFYKKAADEVKTSTDNNSGNIRVADMTKYLKNEYIPMTFGVAENERIDVMTGNLSLSFPLAAIAGAGGADLSLSISYNSSDSGITDKSWGGTFYTSYYVRYGELLMTTNDSGGHVSYYGENSIKYFATEHDKLVWMSPYVYPVGITVEYEGREAIYYETAILEEGTFESPLPASKPKTYLADSNGLAPGWRFDIPVLEKLDNPSASASTSSNSVSESNSDPDTGTGESTPPDVFYLLHFGGSSYRIKNLGFENRKTTDLSIEAVDITVCERTAVFLLTAKDGAKYYFDADGNIICSEDRFGRKIKYTFTVIGGKPYLSSITDDFGRSITVTYTGGAIASVSAPGNATVSFATAGSDFSSRTINSISYGGGETTSFTYLENSIGKSALYGRFDVETAEEEVIASVETEYRLISQVTYPNGDKTDYVYDTIYAEWGTDGLEELFAISSRKDTVSDAVKNLYTYTNCSGYYTMQALSGISAEERDMYWSGFTSYTNDIISGNRIVHYTFNEDNLCVNESTTHKLTDGKELMLSETDTTYNSYKLKSNVVYRNYGSGGSTSCVSSEAFSYDAKGNITSHRDATGNIISYTYDPLYSLVINETSKQNSTAVVTKEYTLTDDKKSVATEKLLENDTLISHFDYTYNARGNVVTRTEHLGIVNVITNYTYTYRLDGALIEKNDRNGTKFTYTYDSMLRPVEDKAEKDDKTQVISYTYTATGAVRSKANETATLLYTYDSLGRVATETEISGNTSAKNEYFYNSRDLRTDHKLYRNDLLVSWMGYEYDALGRVISACTKEEISVPTYPDYSGKWHVVPSSGSEYDMNFTLSDIPPEIHSVEITDTRTNTKKYFYVPQEWELDEADGAYHSGTVTHDGTNFTGTYGIYQEFENESHVYNYTQITTYPASGLTANEYSERIYIFNDNNEIKYTVYVKRLSDGGIDNELTNIVYIRAGSHDLGENSFFAPTYHTEIVSHEPFVRYTYDAVGNRTSEIKDDGSIVTYTYNAANLLKTMITTVGNEIQQSDTYTYYLDGNVESIKDKNNAETIYTYDSLGRIKSEEITLDGTRQCMISYTYDSAGNRATKESNGTTTTYTDVYDFALRKNLSITNLINNLMGYYPQEKDILTNYQYELSFTVQIKVER